MITLAGPLSTLLMLRLSPLAGILGSIKQELIYTALSGLGKPTEHPTANLLNSNFLELYTPLKHTVLLCLALFLSTSSEAPQKHSTI
jgi:hypothetical protein